jgi:hypothetical protein
MLIISMHTPIKDWHASSQEHRNLAKANLNRFPLPPRSKVSSTLVLCWNLLMFSRYRATFQWSHYRNTLVGNPTLPASTEACASVTSAFLQVS